MPVENCHNCGRFTSDGYDARLHDSYNRDEYVTYCERCLHFYTECEFCYEPVRMRDGGYYIGNRRVARNAVSARRFQGARYHRATYHDVTGGHMHEYCQDAWEDEQDAWEDEYDDEYGHSSRPSEDMVTCRDCNTRNTYLDLDTEQFLCECEARRAHVAGHEVHGWPPLTVHVSDTDTTEVRTEVAA